MAITYPRTLPTTRWSAMDFKPLFIGNSVQLAGGLTQYREAGDTRWQCDLTTVPLFPGDPTDRALIGVMRAWWMSLRGGLKTFLAYDKAHEYPITYPNGTGIGAWGGTGTVSSISANAFTAGSVLSGLQLKAGDWVGFEKSGKYSLHVVTEDKTASGTTISSVPFEPAINTSVFTTTFTARFIQAKAEFLPLAGSFSAPESTQAQPISFSGIQKLYTS